MPRVSPNSKMMYSPSYILKVTDGDKKFQCDRPTITTAVYGAKQLAWLCKLEVEVRTASGKLICDVFPDGRMDVSEFGSSYL